MRRGRTAAVYGDGRINAVTVRAELSRLRRTLGESLLDSRPYRLRRPVAADFLAVPQLLQRGEVGAALDAYRGPLLPGSDAPGVNRARRVLEGQLRAAVLGCGDPRVLDAWTRSHWGCEDRQVWEALADVLSPGSGRRIVALDRVDTLTREYGG